MSSFSLGSTRAQCLAQTPHTHCKFSTSSSHSVWADFTPLQLNACFPQSPPAHSELLSSTSGLSPASHGHFAHLSHLLHYEPTLLISVTAFIVSLPWGWHSPQAHCMLIITLQAHCIHFTRRKLTLLHLSSPCLALCTNLTKFPCNTVRIPLEAVKTSICLGGGDYKCKH